MRFFTNSEKVLESWTKKKGQTCTFIFFDIMQFPHAWLLYQTVASIFKCC